MIIKVDKQNINKASKVHAISWQESHHKFCSEDFILLHTPKRQQEYIQKKIDKGYEFYLLMKEIPVGVISISPESVIEDLYILPEHQKKGYGSQLLTFAISKCKACPKLWILENNQNAKRLYKKMGFCETGNVNCSGKLSEIEMEWRKRL